MTKSEVPTFHDLDAKVSLVPGRPGRWCNDARKLIHAPDGRYLLVANEGRVRIFDTLTNLYKDGRSILGSAPLRGFAQVVRRRRRFRLASGNDEPDRQDRGQRNRADMEHRGAAHWSRALPMITAPN